ncbi:acetyltransferase (GNAT) family protein [Hasllibacter halocynthiae]|uniref:Acetyltransferase (GNAT) family protein n=1 Tax=Hasllibacter halocynthiae TaxID=595589 RepID=A0A2T0X1W9_9RHOB|nr:GNAT family N-acetyltransferase [Hasllibacter halocynthiae]PRY92942.1 acetyltransferase (GNAT) family protein [Hasllibacter halocynthiae]
MTAPDAARVMAAVRATWPPAGLDRIGAFDLPRDREGSGRATSARVLSPPAPADVDALLAARPGVAVCVVEGVDHPGALGARGFAPGPATLLMAGPAAPLAEGEAPPPGSGRAHWPPLAALGALWDATGNPAIRRAPAHRAPGPKAAILLRVGDRVAGGLFAGVDGGCAALHMVVTRPGMRRRGVGMLGMRHAADFARGHGAEWLVLPVDAANAPALALYRGAGLREVGRYRYWGRA